MPPSAPSERAVAGARRPRRLPSGRVLVAASSIVLLVAAGGLGWVVTRGNPFEASPASGAAGATGATGPAGVEAAVPAPTTFGSLLGDDVVDQALGDLAAGPAPALPVGDARADRADGRR